MSQSRNNGEHGMFVDFVSTTSGRVTCLPFNTNNHHPNIIYSSKNIDMEMQVCNRRPNEHCMLKRFGDSLVETRDGAVHRLVSQKFILMDIRKGSLK